MEALVTAKTLQHLEKKPARCRKPAANSGEPSLHSRQSGLFRLSSAHWSDPAPLGKFIELRGGSTTGLSIKRRLRMRLEQTRSSPLGRAASEKFLTTGEISPWHRNVIAAPSLSSNAKPRPC
jgi:hypothetical protein